MNAIGNDTTAMARLLSRLALIRHRGEHKNIEQNVDALWPQYVDDARAVLALINSDQPK